MYRFEELSPLVLPYEKEDSDSDVTTFGAKRQLHHLWGRFKFSSLKSATYSVLFKLLPSPIQSLFSPKKKTTPRPTAWLDGIRGIAAIIVFFEHFALSVQDSRSMITAYGSPDSNSLWQLPIIRLLYDGSPMVPIFYVTSGCALSLKPLSHIKQQDWEGFGTTISSATFRRGFRLFVPSAAISFIIMLLLQMGIYSQPYSFIGESIIIIDPPPRLDSFASQFVDWLDWIISRLLYSDELFQPLEGRTNSNYGFQLWTISTEFYASLMLFITLVGLARLTVAGRYLLVVGLCGLAFHLGRWDIACFLGGILVAEIPKHGSRDRVPNTERFNLPTYTVADANATLWRSSIEQCAFALLLVAGLFVASFPGRLASTNPFYANLSAIVSNARFWESIGAFMILLSVSRLRILQQLLALSVPAYLGRMSYSMYLTHVAFLNVFGWKVVPWVWTLIGADGWGHEFGILIGLVVCLSSLLWIADVWTRVIDDPCVKLAKKVERWAYST